MKNISATLMFWTRTKWIASLVVLTVCCFPQPTLSASDEDQQLLKELEGRWSAEDGSAGFEITVRLPDIVEIQQVWLYWLARKEIKDCRSYCPRYVGRIQGNRIKGTWKEHPSMTLECRFSGRIVNEDKIVLKKETIATSVPGDLYTATGCNQNVIAEIALKSGL